MGGGGWGGGRGAALSLTHLQYQLCKNIYTTLAIIVLSRTEEPAKVGTCARDRRALQQLALNVHVKHFDLDLDNGQVAEGRKEMFYLTTRSTHFIYGYMASHIW